MEVLMCGSSPEPLFGFWVGAMRRLRLGLSRTRAIPLTSGHRRPATSVTRKNMALPRTLFFRILLLFNCFRDVHAALRDCAHHLGQRTRPVASGVAVESIANEILRRRHVIPEMCVWSMG